MTLTSRTKCQAKCNLYDNGNYHGFFWLGPAIINFKGTGYHIKGLYCVIYPNNAALKGSLQTLLHSCPLCGGYGILLQPCENAVFFPTCQVRVVRFYVSCLLRPPPASCLPPASSSSSPRPPRPTATCDPQRSCRTSTTTIHAQCSLPDLNHDHPRPVFPAGPQPRPSPPSVPCRTSTTTIHAQCSLPDLNHDHPRPVFPAGPQPRPSTPSVPCRTSTASIHAKCSLPDLM